MTDQQTKAMIDGFLAAWNAQDVDALVACYTDDLTYCDPNTRGEVRGAEAMRHYLAKLFSEWTMHWSLREFYPFSVSEGGAFLWRATFKKRGGTRTVEADGMDLVLLEGGRINRNDVYFDRTVLLPIMDA